MKRLAVDGNSIANRAFFGVRPLTARDGTPTQAVYGFLNLLLKMIKEEAPDETVICFDVAKKTFRNTLYADYKGTRKGMPEDLAIQMPYIRILLHKMGIPVLGVTGFEADDLLGTLAKKSCACGQSLVIATGDRDSLQLVTDCVTVRLLTSSKQGPVTKQMTPAAVQEMYGLSPAGLIDLKAIMGDSSDNIPGVPGIGEKGAAKLLADFGSLDGVYANLDSQLLTKSVRQKLIDGKESAYLSQKLGTIFCDVPLQNARMIPDEKSTDLICAPAAQSTSPEMESTRDGCTDCTVPWDTLLAATADPTGVQEILRHLELYSLQPRLAQWMGLSLPGEQAPPAREPAEDTLASHREKSHREMPPRDVANCWALVTPDVFEKACAKAKQTHVGLAFDPNEISDATEQSGMTLSLFDPPCEAMVQLTLATPQVSFYTGLPKAEIIGFLKKLANPIAVFSLQQLALDGVQLPLSPDFPNRFTDLSLCAYLLYPTNANYSPQRLCEPSPEHADSLNPGTGESTGATGTPVDLPKTANTARDAAYVAAAAETYLRAIDAGGLTFLLRQVEQPLALILAQMEKTGVALDTDAVRAFAAELENDLATLEQEIYTLSGREFLLSSPKQLSAVLFDAPEAGGLGLKSGKKTKTGFSTNADVLQGLVDEHPVIAKILEHRQLSKLLGTYTGSLIALTGKDGRVHSHFVQTETRTGRISSVSPNLQNIPVRTPRGAKIRSFFHAKDGCVLCDADYSQIELRVLAHLSADPAMTKAFQEGEDIHLKTATQVFHTTDVTPELRRRAKAVNFGIVYGQGAYSLSQDLGISMKTAKDYIAGYFATYQGVQAFMEQTVADAQETGISTTLYGRIRPIPELKAANKMTHAFGERVARNTPIQGTAADIIKLAMVRVSRVLADKYPTARLILQVHDELIVECAQADAPGVCQLMEREMAHAAELCVPLPADAHFGHTWAQAKGE